MFSFTMLMTMLLLLDMFAPLSPSLPPDLLASLYPHLFALGV